MSSSSPMSPSILNVLSGSNSSSSSSEGGVGNQLVENASGALQEGSSSSSSSSSNAPSHGITPVIQNVVATVNLQCSLELKKIAMKARNAEYNPKRFSAVIMRIRDPKTTALVFSSGKMVVTGARSEEAAKIAARKYARIIQKLGFSDVRFTQFKIQNIVGSCGVNFAVRLEGLHLAHQDFSTYEPELFPGLIYRMLVPKIVLLIFVSGKVVLTGAKNRQDIYHAFDSIFPLLATFRKDNRADNDDDEDGDMDDEDDL